MDEYMVLPRFYADTFGGRLGPVSFDYAHDMIDAGENLGFRTPFQDADLVQADAIFDKILAARAARKC